MRANSDACAHGRLSDATVASYQSEQLSFFGKIESEKEMGNEKVPEALKYTIERDEVLAVLHRKSHRLFIAEPFALCKFFASFRWGLGYSVLLQTLKIRSQMCTTHTHTNLSLFNVVLCVCTRRKWFVYAIYLPFESDSTANK